MTQLTAGGPPPAALLRMLFLTMLLLTVLLAPSAQAAPLDSFQFQREITTPDITADEILSITLDSPVYAGTQNGLADVRAIDSGGLEVPYQLDKVIATRTTNQREACPSHVISLKELAGDSGQPSLEIVIRLDNKSPAASGLTVRTPLRDFQHNVQVFGRAEAQDWQPLVPEALIFDYSRYMDVSKRDVPLPANNFREFRLLIDDVTDEQRQPLKELTRHLHAGVERERTERTTVRERSTRIDAVDFYHLAPHQEPGKEVKTAYPLTNLKTEEDEKNRLTIVDVRSRREPLTSLTLKSEMPNWVRRAVVQVPDGSGAGDGWRDLCSATISAIRFRDFKQDQSTISFPEQRESAYRLVIHNEDNPPLTVTEVLAEGNQYQLQFLAGSHAPYRLYYGSTVAASPRYDVATLMAALGGHYQSKSLTLGPEQNNPGFHEPINRRPFDSRLFFGAAILLAVGIMSVLVYGALKRVDQLPTDQ
ncbi:MAG TPA: DUF3999 family protein [Pirellulales bacterium]|jgi:hypothetical protein